MSAIVPLLCLLLGGLLTLGMLWLLARRAWRQLAVAEAYREASRRLGLILDTRGLSIRGYLGERRIWIGEVMVGHGPRRRSEVRGVLRLEHPLGFGLRARKRGGRRFLRRRRTTALNTGYADLDRRLEFQADNPERVHELLNERVVAALRTLVRRWPDLTVTDHHVRVYLGQSETSADGLEELLMAMDGLGNALVETRRELSPPPALVPWVEPWKALAERLELDFDSAFPSMTGTLSGRQVTISAKRAGENYAAAIRIHFEDREELGLRVVPQHGPDGYWSVGQDIQIGHEAFDRAFVIKGYDPGRVRDMLNPSLCDLFVELLDIGPVETDDRVLQLDEVPLEAAQVERAVRLLDHVAAALAW